MSRDQFQLESKDLEALEEKLTQLPGEGEAAINSMLHGESARTVMNQVVEFLPVSRRNKKHAKYSNPFRISTFNLGFQIVTKGGAANSPGSFGYLVFPDEGRGNRNPREQNFTGRAIAAQRPRIMNRLLEALTNRIEEVL